MTPSGFKRIDHTRDGSRGSGTALLVKEILHVKTVDAGEKSSFEYFERVVNCGSRKLKILIIYRIPYSFKHPITRSAFLTHLQVTWNQ